MVTNSLSLKKIWLFYPSTFSCLQWLIFLFCSQAFRQSNFYFGHSLDGSMMKATMASSLSHNAVMPPADLTPAVDKYARLPEDLKINLPVEYKYKMKASGPSPSGPDPFALVASELQSLSDYVKDLVVSENPVLTLAASHFFEQVLFKIFLLLLPHSLMNTHRGKENDFGQP